LPGVETGLELTGLGRAELVIQGERLLPVVAR
jgi:hypothetical protein